MATIANPTTIVAVHEAGTDFTNAHDTDPSAISPTTVNNLVGAARPVLKPVDLGTGATLVASITNIKNGIIVATPGAATALTLPGTADLISGLELSANNMTARFIVRNLATATYAITVASSDQAVAATGGSSGTVNAASTVEFLIRRSGSSAVEIISL